MRATPSQKTSVQMADPRPRVRPGLQIRPQFLPRIRRSLVRSRAADQAPKPTIAPTPATSPSMPSGLSTIAPRSQERSSPPTPEPHSQTRYPNRPTAPPALPHEWPARTAFGTPSLSINAATSATWFAIPYPLSGRPEKPHPRGVKLVTRAPVASRGAISPKIQAVSHPPGSRIRFRRGREPTRHHPHHKAPLPSLRPSSWYLFSSPASRATIFGCRRYKFTLSPGSALKLYNCPAASGSETGGSGTTFA